MLRCLDEWLSICCVSTATVCYYYYFDPGFMVCLLYWLQCVYRFVTLLDVNKTERKEGGRT